MAVDRRNVDRNDLDAMTRDYLAKGGKIVQCPPGSSENVVYKRNSFRRRPGNAGSNAEGAANVNADANADASGTEGSPPAEPAKDQG